MTFEQMKNVDIRTVDPTGLVDIRDVVIKADRPVTERIKDYARQTGNPYCFKCGKIIIKIGFSNTHITLNDRMETYLRTI